MAAARAAACEALSAARGTEADGAELLLGVHCVVAGSDGPAHEGDVLAYDHNLRVRQCLEHGGSHLKGQRPWHRCLWRRLA
eukprot:scaffold38351_cov63-Phaeocystis_antarctica.AAC.6